MSGRFLIEVKYWKRNFNNLNKKKQTNRKTEKKKKKKNETISFWKKLYLRFTVFAYHNFSFKNIYEGVPFYKIDIIVIKSANYDWVMKMMGD